MYKKQKIVKDLDILFQNRDYDSMNLKDLKAENEALREKLKSFNQQLTEKIEHNQPLIQKQAAQQSSSSQPRSRSTQMRTADAEQENNIKILKRLQDEYDKLEQRQQIVEDQGYSTKLKQQIETSKQLINKFKLQIKQIILKNDQQAKELSKIDQGDGVPDSVREQQSLKLEIQQFVDKINELEKKKEDYDDLFKKKSDLIDVKEQDLNQKIKEAKQLNVDVSLTSHSYKRKEKYKELQKVLDQLEKSNQTQAKLAQTKENIQRRELEEIQKEIQEKDLEINQMEILANDFKNKVQDRIDREKIYSNHMRDLFNKLPEVDHEVNPHHKSTESMPVSKSKNRISPSPIKHNNLISPSKSKQSSNSKPNLKLGKKDDNLKFKSLAKQELDRSQEIKEESESGVGINFHQKINSRTNLNQNKYDSEQKEEVISKPFNFKKGNQEARVWKPEDNQSAQQLSPQNQNGSKNNIESNAPVYNFKKKNDEQSKQQSSHDLQSKQNNLHSSENLNNQSHTQNQENNKEQEDSTFSKPQRMFKFKRDNANNENSGGGYNPIDSIGQGNANQAQPQQPSQNVQPKQQEDTYNFSANSRVARNRGGVQNSNADNQISKPEEEKTKLTNSNPTEVKNQLGTGYNPTALNNQNNNNSVGGGYNPTLLGNSNNNNTAVGGSGYTFSGAQDKNQNSSLNTLNNLSDSYQPTGVSRRRGAGNNPSNNALGEENDNKLNNNQNSSNKDFVSGYQPSSIGTNNQLSSIGANNQPSSIGGNNQSYSFGGNNQNQGGFNFNGNNNLNSNNNFGTGFGDKTSLNNNTEKKDDELPTNIVSRRRGNQQKNENPAGEYNFGEIGVSKQNNEPNNASNNNNNNDNKWSWNNNSTTNNNNNNLTNFNTNNNENKWNLSNNNNTNNINTSDNNNKENKWSWNNNSNDQNNNIGGINNNQISNKVNQNQVQSSNDNTFGITNQQQSQEQPKAFNFKRNQEQKEAQQQQQAQQNEQKQESSNTQIPTNISKQPEQKQATQQQQQQKKADDDVAFMGPNDRRRPKKQNVAEAAKVQKRDIFGSDADNDNQGFNLAAPKEVGGTTNSYQAPQTVAQKSFQPSANNNQKSALDDDDDLSGLDFLKQDKPKTNYNDDDDDLFGKKPSNPVQQPVQQQSQQIGFGKKKEEDKQEREKQLAEKAQKNDFFDDLF